MHEHRSISNELDNVIALSDLGDLTAHLRHCVEVRGDTCDSPTATLIYFH